MNNRTATLTAIADQHLGYTTLTDQNCHLDFREVSTWGVREALEAAYEAGRRAEAAEGGCDRCSPEADDGRDEEPDVSELTEWQDYDPDC